MILQQIWIHNDNPSRTIWGRLKRQNRWDPTYPSCHGASTSRSYRPVGGERLQEGVCYCPLVGGWYVSYGASIYTAPLTSSGSAGIAELIIFHPVDTIAKRLMSNQGRVATASRLNEVVFKDKAQVSAVKKFGSLFPGLGYAAAYKVGRTILSGKAQLLTGDIGAAKNIQIWRPTFRQRLLGNTSWRYVRPGIWQGQRQGNHACNCWQVGGQHSFTRSMLKLPSLIGIGEIVLLPLDVLKIKRQTNPEAFRGRGVFRIVADEGFGLYRGAGWTAARNAPGSFAVRATLPPTSNEADILPAFWRLRCGEAVLVQIDRLQYSILVAEFCCFDSRCYSLACRVSTFGCNKNADPEPEFR